MHDGRVPGLSHKRKALSIDGAFSRCQAKALLVCPADTRSNGAGGTHPS